MSGSLGGNKLVVTTAALAAGTSLALSGCSAEAPQPPQDATPLVSDYLAQNPYTEYGIFDTSTIANTFANTTLKPGQTQAYDDPLKYDVGAGSTGSRSSQLLEVHADKTGTLHYSASEKLPAKQLTQLLHAVDSRSDRLRSVMMPDTAGKIALQSIKFRAFDPKDPVGKYEQSHILYAKHDLNEGDTPNLYYFLPGSDTINYPEIPEMLGHEVEHAALGQGEKEWLTPTQAERLTKACKVLGKEAIDANGYQFVDGLERLKEVVDPKYGPAIDQVTDAFRDGTYTDLPRADQAASVPACTQQVPAAAIRKAITDQGGDSQVFQKSIEGAPGVVDRGAKAINNELTDEFYDSARRDFTYHGMFESTYLPAGSTPNLGHPPDNEYELGASSGNVALTHPDEFLSTLRYAPADVQAAEADVLAIDAEILSAHYPGSALAKSADDMAKQLANRK